MRVDKSIWCLFEVLDFQVKGFLCYSIRHGKMEATQDIEQWKEMINTAI